MDTILLRIVNEERGICVTNGTQIWRGVFAPFAQGRCSVTLK